MAAAGNSKNFSLAPPQPHVAIFPCAGMGHLIPSLRLAHMLSSRRCTVTLITPLPTVSAAESDHITTFFTTHPTIQRLEFHLLPHKKSGFTNEDPFWIQVESIGNSVHLLRPLLSSLSPPLNAIIADLPVSKSITQLASDLQFSYPIYTLITTSARFFSVMTHLHRLSPETNHTSIDVPGLGPIPVSSLPPPMLDQNHFFSENIRSNVSSLSKVKGVLLNTFDFFEPEAIQGLRNNLKPSIFPIGPFENIENPSHDIPPWLDEQKPESVVFVNFGSRTALSKDQILELSSGLEKSGCKFLWVLKTSKVDKEDKEELENVVEKSFLERTEKNGLVIKGWVDQCKILGHRAIGGFVSHCGWNSVMEAARLGVPILAWPQHGDQRINAEVVEKGGLGVWVKEWDWSGERVVEGDEIAGKIKELMLSESLREKAVDVKEKARQGRESDGSSERLLVQSLIEDLKTGDGN